MRNPYLSRGMLRILKMMAAASGRDGESSYDAELVTDGNKWYVGAESVDATSGRDLVAFDLVAQCSHDGRYRGYRLTEEGRRVLDEPGYVPPALTAS